MCRRLLPNSAFLNVNFQIVGSDVHVSVQRPKNAIHVDIEGYMFYPLHLYSGSVTRFETMFYIYSC